MSIKFIVTETVGDGTVTHYEGEVDSFEGILTEIATLREVDGLTPHILGYMPASVAGKMVRAYLRDGGGWDGWTLPAEQWDWDITQGAADIVEYEVVAEEGTPASAEQASVD